MMCARRAPGGGGGAGGGGEVQHGEWAASKIRLRLTEVSVEPVQALMW